MKTLFFIICVLYINVGYSQQFSFQKLLSMVSDRYLFEKSMLSIGNNTVEIKDQTIYSYATSNGTMGATNDIPTNNKLYEERWELENGKVLLNSKIDSMEIDDDYTLRNKLRSQGQPINKEIISGYHFVNSKLIRLTKSEKKESFFAENYNYDRKEASTFYTLEHEVQKDIIINNEFIKAKNTSKIRVFFVRKTDYLNILKQITAMCKYVGTKKDLDVFKSSYLIGSYLIEVQKDEREDIGGTVEIIKN